MSLHPKDIATLALQRRVKQLQREGWQPQKAWLSDAAKQRGLSAPALRARLKRGTVAVRLEKIAVGNKTIMVREI